MPKKPLVPKSYLVKGKTTTIPQPLTLRKKLIQPRNLQDLTESTDTFISVERIFAIM